MTSFIITGATSMIGISLCQYISSLDSNLVYAVCREGSKGLKRVPKRDNVKVVYANLQHICDIAKVIERADVFIHLAWGGTDHKGRNDSKIQEENIKYSLEAIQVAQQLGCRLFVEAGSQAEYGYKTDLITEDSLCRPENEYGKAKLKLGTLAQKMCAGIGIKYIHLRIFSLFGETDHKWTLIMSTIPKMLKNEDIELSPCTQKWNFLYVKDAVKQIYLLCKHALNDNDFKSEIYNIGSHDTRILKNFILEMYQLTNSKSILLFGAYKPANIVSLNPSVTKTESATNGFISEHTFGEVVKKIIDNYKNGIYEKG